MKPALIIGSTCVDVIINLDHLPKTEENDMNDTTKQGTQGSSGMNPKKFPTSSLTANKTA